MNITTAIEEITPQRAAEMLEHNTHNRRPSRFTVEMYAREMESGAWKLTGESIKIAQDGTILDGQHRLMACVRSGVSFRTMVVRGIEREAQFNMDQGQRRATGQQLGLKGHSNASTKAAAARFIIAWEGGRNLGARPPGRVSVTETMGVITRWPTIDEAAKLAKRARDKAGALLPVSVLCCFLTLALRANAEKAREFMVLFEDGAGMGSRHPVLVLRNQCASYALQRKELTREDQMSWLTLAWKDFLDGNSRRGAYKRGYPTRLFPGVPTPSQPEDQPSSKSFRERTGPQDEYVTIREASEATGWGRETIRSWVHQKRVDAYKDDPNTVRSRFFVRLADVQAMTR